jgi:signal transduction histidine kinase
LSLRLRLYVAAVVAAGAMLLWTHVPPEAERLLGHYVAWAVIALVSESLWLATLSGTGTVSMASTAGLATALLWGQAPAIWIGALTTVLADLAVQRKTWYRALFNGGQTAITQWIACAAFGALGGPLAGIRSLDPLPAGDLAALRLALPTLALFVVYLLVNRALVATAIAWSTERPYRRVLREDWFYTERLLQDGAAFMLSPLMVVSFLATGYAGVVLFFAPLYIFNEATRRFLELKRAQDQMIHTERMAAKGEMAAEVGHELRNQLVAISGRAQMLVKDADREVFDNVQRYAQVILEQTHRMERLSKGLMDFSGAELKMERVDFNELVRRSIEFVRAQNRFDGVSWDVRLVEPLPELRIDPGQIQQVLLNLFMNAADAMVDAGVARKAITVETAHDERARQVKVVVTDTGPGIPASNLAKIFEPHFTTKPTGHGFGLSTSYRIVSNHGGRIVAESPAGEGARFTLTLPLHGPGGWS